MSINSNTINLSCLGLLFCCTGADANIVPSLAISDHMVLQRGITDPIWGSADAGESVTVKFNGQTKSALAGADGKWMIKLDVMPAGGPFVMTLQGKNTVTLQDVMLGEVWLASGQSNMDKTLGAGDTANAADFPLLRYNTSQLTDGKWLVVTPATAASMSKTAYYFGRDLQQKLGVAVGILIGAQGSTHIQRWTDPTVVPADPSFTRGGDLFYYYLEPFRPYAIKGAIWYQGEADADGGMGYASVYGQRLQSLIKMWRKVWGQGDFAFYIVQLPNYHALQINPAQADTSDRWAFVRGEQSAALALPNTAVAVTMDAGEAGNIHPDNKSPFGYRLSLAARALLYGESNLVYSGPRFRSLSIRGSRIHLRFDFTGGGMIAKGGGPLKGFTIAGKDNVFAWADAQIHGDTITLSSAQVASPTQARYAWADNPIFNLYNAEGLPASPFQSSGTGTVSLAAPDKTHRKAVLEMPYGMSGNYRNLLGRRSAIESKDEIRFNRPVP